MNIKRWQLLLPILALAVAIFAVGGAQGANSKPKEVVYLDEALTSYTNPLYAGIQAEAKKHGIKTSRFSAEHDPQKQNQQCSDAIASGKYQGVIIYAPDGAAAQACVKEALAAKMTVVPVNQPVGPKQTAKTIQVPGIKVQVVNDLNGDIAETIKLVEKACKQDKKPPCRIVKTVAIPPYFYSANKLKKEVPAYKKRGYTVVATPTIGQFDDPAGTIAAIKNVLTKTRDIDVIVSDDDSSIQGAVQMKRKGELPKSTLIIGDGGSAKALKAMKDGLQFATIYNAPKTMGAVAMRELVKVHTTGKPTKSYLSFKDINPKGYWGITKKEAAQLKAEW